HDDDRHQAVQQDEQHREAIDAEVVVDVEARDHDTNSTNCIAEVFVSKPTHSGMVTRKPAIAPARATQRANIASCSRRKPSTARPATIGTQIESDRYGIIG